ncbi:Zinc finger, C2H2 type [Popillia japonica]|uniref:Zinc finger, C2H2 type n=1 Tax=Popillia japonica TaxID=7064 RepID=A0AAW1GS47_POPJA
MSQQSKETYHFRRQSGLQEYTSSIGDNSVLYKKEDDITLWSCSCDICHEIFYSSELLDAHMMTTHGLDNSITQAKIDELNPDFKCKYCTKAFTRRRNLTQHIKEIHEHDKIPTAEKPLKCSYCQQIFTQNCFLLRHERVHTGEASESTLEKNVSLASINLVS